MSKTLDTVKYVGRNFWRVLPGGSLVNYSKKVQNMSKEEYEKKWFY
jgi:hypothetical protein